MNDIPTGTLVAMAIIAIIMDVTLGQRHLTFFLHTAATCAEGEALVKG